MERVRTGSVYVYRAGLLDRCTPASKAQQGQEVRVVNLPGCPPANTMGHCHIEDLGGKFLGMVSVGSLTKRSA